jgi:hypothetical protein
MKRNKQGLLPLLFWRNHTHDYGLFGLGELLAYNPSVCLPGSVKTVVSRGNMEESIKPERIKLSNTSRYESTKIAHDSHPLSRMESGNSFNFVGVVTG